jgi:hypothetical protein
MKKALTIIVAALLANLVQPAASLTAAPLETRTAAGTVKVTIHYKGKGKVDAAHKLWVWVFDSPNIGPTSSPIDQITLDSNDADAVFDGIASETVWIGAAFDESGAMTGNAPPPSGTPIGILAGTDGAPTAVVPAAKAATVVLTFDDSQRMP